MQPGNPRQRCRQLGQTEDQRIDCVHGALRIGPLSQLARAVRVVDKLLNELPKRRETAVRARLPGRIGAIQDHAVIRPDRPLKCGQIGVFTHQAAAFVEHRLDSIDGITRAFRCPAEQGHRGFGSGRDRRFDQFRLVRKVVIEAGAGHVRHAGDFSDGGLRIADLGHTLHGRENDPKPGFLTASADGAAQLGTGHRSRVLTRHSAFVHPLDAGTDAVEYIRLIDYFSCPQRYAA